MIGVKLEGYEAALQMFAGARQGVHKAAGIAINEATKSGKSFISAELRDRAGYKIQKRDLDKSIIVRKKARASDLTAIVDVSGKPISLLYFGAQQYQMIRGTAFKTAGRSWQELKRMPRKKIGQGVSVQVRGARKTIPKTFIGYNKFGEPRVYLRGKGKLAPMFVNTIPTFLMRQGRLERVQDHIGNVMGSRFIHHLDRLMKG